MRMPVAVPKIAALSAALVLLLSACLKTEEFPIEPRVSFKEFNVVGDSGSVVITFTDGDGDIGLDQGDTLPPHAPGQTYYHNLFVRYDKWVEGAWQEVVFALPLYYRVPVVTPTGQNKSLDGEIAVALTPWPISPSFVGDTIRFRVKLVDRALHVSNEAISDAIKVQ
ncbi:MAG: hypothetical protein JNM31_04325 [Flavobacteriales bacterium]|nr:hypothetical protein [Flavobacteriales bacterium]